MIVSDFGSKLTEVKVDPSLLKKTPAEIERHVMQAVNQGLAKVSLYIYIIFCL